MGDEALAHFKYDEPLPRWAVDKTVTNAVSLAFDLYKEKVLDPMHEANDTRLKSIETVMLKIQGALTAFVWIGSIGTFVATICAIVHYTHH